jgi:hypothetical protein
VSAHALAVGTHGDGAERALEIEGAGGEFVRLVFSCDRREHLARKIIEVRADGLTCRDLSVRAFDDGRKETPAPLTWVTRS